MKELTLEVRGGLKLSPTIMVDGKVVKTKKNNFGTHVCTIKTEKDNVDVAVFRHLEINGRFWFLMNIIYFIVSIFGIFDIMYTKKCVVMDCKFNLEVKEKTKAVIMINNMVNEGRAVEIKSEAGVTEEKNVYFIDKKAKTRRKVAIVTRFVLMIAVVVLAVVLL